MTAPQGPRRPLTIPPPAYEAQRELVAVAEQQCSGMQGIDGDSRYYLAWHVLVKRAELDAERAAHDATRELLAEAEAARFAARDHLHEIARVGDTLSPQEFINHAAAGCACARHEYAGAMDPNKSIVELTRERDEARATNAKLNRRAQELAGAAARYEKITLRIAEHQRGKPLGRIEAGFAIAAAEVRAEAAESRLARLRPLVREAAAVNRLCAIDGESSGSVGIPTDAVSVNQLLDALVGLNDAFHSARADRALAEDGEDASNG